MRARVYGVIGAGAWAAMPLGSIIAGYAAEQLGITITLVAFGVAYLLVTLVPLLGGSWRHMETTQAAPSARRAEPAAGRQER